MAFYYLLLRPWLHFGAGEYWVRLFSVLFGVAAIPIIYLVGVALGNRRTGLIAALLLCVNAAHVAYSQEARSYSLLIFLCLLSLLFLLRIDRPGFANVSAYIVVSALTVYAHFYAVFFLLAQWASLIGLRFGTTAWKKVVAMISLTTVLISPALYYILFCRSGQLGGVPPVRAHDLIQLLYFLVAQEGRFRKPLALLFLFCSVVSVYYLSRRWRAGKARSQDWGLVIVLACALSPPLLTFLISLRVPVFFPRYLLICLAPLVMIAAQGLSELQQRGLRWGICALMVGLSLGSTIHDYSRLKDDWRSLTTYLLNHSNNGDVVVGFPEGAEGPVQYYSRVLQVPSRPALSYLTPASMLRDITDDVAFHRDIPCGRVWFVVWGDNPQAKSLSQKLTPQYRQIDGRGFPVTLSVSLHSDTSSHTRSATCASPAQRSSSWQR